MKKLTGIVCLLALMLTLTACAGAGDWKYEDLPGDYAVWRINSQEIPLVCVDDDPYLFVSPKTGTMFDPDSFRHTHEKILKAIGAEHIRFHDLRHTFATLSLKYGVDVKTLSGALGHYDAGFTLSTYTHATEGMKRDAADTIGSVISQTM